MCAGAVLNKATSGKIRKRHACGKARRCCFRHTPKRHLLISDRQVNAVYNRYIPQSDGSFQKNRVAEQRQQPQQRPKRETPPQKTPCPPPQPACSTPPTPSRSEISAGSFLKQLLPKDFDTGDLLIVLLLLLMAGDCEQEKSTALLTLVLYFFM